MRNLGLIVLIGVSVLSCSLDPGERSIDRVIGKARRELAKEGFTYDGMKVESHAGPWVIQLGILVATQDLVERDEARKMVFHVASVLRDQVNGSRCSKWLFNELPVGLDNVAADIIYVGDGGTPVVDPYVGAVILSSGKVIYLSKSSRELEYSDLKYVETLEEALQKLGKGQF